ncbi:LysR family transcriptional regulator [Vibrio makurazakiensis]|uniref:LysR family transcriptional regulator n=1 Tax=Vibrio makurazakiensis TaxID=2910250 RepID=UPI003D1107A3
MDIQLIYYFVNIVKFGSFTKAAEALKVPKSSLSKAVTKLEENTGTKLLVRSTRKQSLTEAGRLFYESCLGPVQNIEEAEKSLYGMDNDISGTVKITVPEDFEVFLLSSCIQSLCEQYPKLKIIIHSTNNKIDLIGEGYDFAIRIGPLEESNLRVRNIGYIEPITAVSKQYYDQIEVNHPSDLLNVRCLGLGSKSTNQVWRLTKDDVTEIVKTPLVVETNQITSVHKLTLSGVGVSALPTFLCKDDLETGRLIRILKDWRYMDVPVSLVSPQSTINSKRLKVVSDAIVTTLSHTFS